jgi:hypothetical protein
MFPEECQMFPEVAAGERHLAEERGRSARRDRELEAHR